MRRSIELSEAGEGTLRGMAQTMGSSEDALLQALTEALLRAESANASERFSLTLEGQEIHISIESRAQAIRSSSEVLGGDARVRDTRIPVWLLVAHKKWGESDSEILAQYPSLNAADLSATWDYYTGNTERVDAERRANEDAD